MLEKIILSERIKEQLTDICISYNEEFGGYFLGEITSEGIYVDQGVMEKGEDNDASINYVPREFWNKVKTNPEKYVLIPAHIHSRKLDETIKSYDPVWSGGDSKVMEASNIKNDVEYNIFVHPKSGCEGEKMSRDKVQITCYKYNPLNLSKVKEIESGLAKSFDEAYLFCKCFCPDIDYVDPKILKKITSAVNNIAKNYKKSA